MGLPSLPRSQYQFSTASALFRSTLLSISFLAVPYEFDAVGMGNIVDGSGQGNGSTFVAEIDNFSFTPEPSTAAMLGLAGLLSMRRRRHAT